MKAYDAIWINGLLVTCQKELNVLNDAAIAVKSGKIAWLGSMKELKASPNELAEQVHDLQGRCLTPGFIDCHTHLIYAGNRAHEFALRLKGATYEEIAKQGGGIQATVTSTRAASSEILLAQSLVRARALMISGVTTIEIKSGYGLDLETELKMLRVAKQIGEVLPVTVRTTFLGAHALPVEFKGRADDYIAWVCNDMVPAVAKEGLADAVDVFCERIAFNLEQTERVFETAKKYNLQVKCHGKIGIGDQTMNFGKDVQMHRPLPIFFKRLKC